ncbi:MAG: DUF3549 family protein [Candidatus Thiodiazotropha sp.]
MSIHERPFDTLVQLLESGGLKLDIYDMGRRVCPIPQERFLAFERTEAPYPYPLQQQAWFALTLYDPVRPDIDPIIWFIRFPLDELAKLLQSARDDFLHRLIDNLADNRLESAEASALDKALQDNPYLFQPRKERLAVLHARLTATLGKPASRYYEHARSYLNGDLSWDQWAFIGYQGIADVAARLDSDPGLESLSLAISNLPPAPLEALCHCLENSPVPDDISQALIQRLEVELEQPTANPQVLTSTLRGISHSTSDILRNELIKMALLSELSTRTDLLTCIAGRAWESLYDANLRDLFLERLAQNEAGQEFFNAILSDLLYLPDTRSSMQASLRQTQRSEQLTQAIGRFFNHVMSAQSDPGN